MRRVVGVAQRMSSAFGCRFSAKRANVSVIRRDMIWAAASLSVARVVANSMNSAAFHALVPYEGGDDDGT